MKRLKSVQANSQLMSQISHQKKREICCARLTLYTTDLCTHALLDLQLTVQAPARLIAQKLRRSSQELKSKHVTKPHGMPNLSSRKAMKGANRARRLSTCMGLFRFLLDCQIEAGLNLLPRAREIVERAQNFERGFVSVYC